MTYIAQFMALNQALRYGLDRQKAKLERFRAQLDFAHRLCGAHPDQGVDWRERIIQAGQLVQEGMNVSGADLEALIAQAETVLAPIGKIAKTYSLLCVSHAHIDMNWRWSWPETVAVANDTFRTMLTLMDEFPEFIFSQDQASTYHLIEQYNPALFDAIRRRVQEGRWEVTASQWVEGDKNMASGESLTRHLLYTRAYIQEKFGLSPEDVQVDFEPDTFGHPAILPTLLARGGIKYYYHCRGSHGPHLYWWVGPDGARILAFNDVQWYMHMDAGRIEVNHKVAEPLVEFSRATGLKSMLLLYGVGDHGGGPTRRDVKRLIEMDSWPIFPNVKFSTLHNFFRMAEVEAKGAASVYIPEIVGERNRVFTGCYTSQARQKWANRHGENLLFTAEAAATLGDRLADVPYPQANLEEAWRRLLFDQFHDILPGSGVRETRHYAMGHAQETQAAAGMARTNALRALSERVNTAKLREALGRDAARAYKDALEGNLDMGAGVGNVTGTGGESAVGAAQMSDRAFMIFNPLPYPRADVVEVKLWNTQLDKAQLVVTSEGVDPQPVQVLEEGRYWGHDYVTVAFPVHVPALGYRTVCLSDRMAELGLLEDSEAPDPWAGMGGSWRMITPPDYVLENEYLKVCLDPASGGLASLLDKRTGREWVPEGQVSGFLQYCVEENIGMSAWVIGPFLTQEDVVDGGTLKKVRNGPYVNTFRWTRKVHETTVKLDITVRQGVPRVEFRLRVDWREIGHAELGIPHLRVRFPLAIDRPTPRYEVPFAAVARDLHDGEEVPAQRWVDVSESDGQGMTLANTSKYGFSLDGEALTMTLLRASIDPDPLPDLGEHVIDYALVPHGADWKVGAGMQAGETLNIPLVVLGCGFHAGDLPPTFSFVYLDKPNVRLVALKKAQTGDGIVLRLVEVEGEETETWVKFASQLVPDDVGVVEVDLLERPTDVNGASLEDDVLLVDVPPFGITTVRIA